MVRHRVTQSGTLTFPSRQSPQHQGNLIFSTAVLRGAEAGREPEPGANFNVLLSWKEDVGGSCLLWQNVLK